MKYRTEKDSMGNIEVPQDALWGAQTQRAVENFAIGSGPLPYAVIKALGLIKEQAAIVNLELGLIEEKISKAVSAAAKEVHQGKLVEHFPVDIFQTGSGTSSNMNANEVIAKRASQIFGIRVHPNDHVNMCQSSNDVFPSSIHIAAYDEINKRLLPAVNDLKDQLHKKSVQFKDVYKIGRTHLQDALPMTLGQEFSGYEVLIARSESFIEETLPYLTELPLGGTAIGTGLNAHKDFAVSVIKKICEKTGLPFKKADNNFEAMSHRGALLKLSSALKDLAASLYKIAQDIRWLSSGPFGGLAEIKIPEVQPGSSIMPGKVNPVIPESMLQICVQVIANDTAVTLAASNGNFELNVMMPLIARNIFDSINLLSAGITLFSSKCILGVEADEHRCREMMEKSLMLVTNLTGEIGYDKASMVAKKAYQERKTLRQVLKEENILPDSVIDELLDPSGMTGDND